MRDGDGEVMVVGAEKERDGGWGGTSKWKCGGDREMVGRDAGSGRRRGMECEMQREREGEGEEEGEEGVWEGENGGGGRGGGGGVEEGGQESLCMRAEVRCAYVLLNLNHFTYHGWTQRAYMV